MPVAQYRPLLQPMPVYLLEDDDLWFPDVEEAREDGLLAVGGTLTPERLIVAYRSGIFPWYNEEDPPLWWSPDPRFVLFPDELKVSKTMKQVIRRQAFEFRINTSFHDVITNCRHTIRKGMDGSWITDEIIAAYTYLHTINYVHCAEAWQNGKLVGGLYGIRIGDVFCGESMFSKVSNASKFAFICYAQLLQRQGVQLIDCQVHTPHLESLGARMIPREAFIAMLANENDGK